MRNPLLLASALLSLVLPVLAAPSPLPALPGSSAYESWHSGSTTDFVPAPDSPTRPGLLLKGGGGDVEAAWRWFLDCAAGGDVLVLRAGGGDAYQSYLFEQIGGVSSVTTIKFNDASAAHDPAVLARIASAEAVFLAGGDQARYIRFWKDSPVAEALNAHLAAGKPLGGTSAGLAVLGEFYFSALRDTITSAQALSDPFHARLTLGDGFLSTPRLAGVVTDSHFSERRRQGRLLAFLARLRAEHPDAPRLVGLGIDEATALCIEPEGSARVHTAKAGSAWLLRIDSVDTLAPGIPLEARGTAVAITPASAFDVNTLELGRPGPAFNLRAAGGRLETSP